LGTDLRIWSGLLPYLAANYRLICYDKRGHGLSDCPPGPYALRDHTEDLAGLLTHLNIADAVLIGDSVGGMITLDFALRFPERVQAIIPCDTAAKIGTAAYWHERITAVRQNGIEPLADAILERWFSPDFVQEQPAAYRGYRHMLTRTPVAGYAATCEAIRDADLREQVGQISVPAFVLCGAEDRATPPELVHELAESLAHGRFSLIARAGHIPSIEQPAIMAGLIEAFLQEIGYV
jgi:3-oxoadipate enol-lactonase